MITNHLTLGINLEAPITFQRATHILGNNHNNSYYMSASSNVSFTKREFNNNKVSFTDTRLSITYCASHNHLCIYNALINFMAPVCEVARFNVFLLTLYFLLFRAFLQDSFCLSTLQMTCLIIIVIIIIIILVSRER